MKQVDTAVNDYLKGTDGDVILAGVESVTAMYRQVSRWPRICENEVSGNVDHERSDVLVEKCAAVIEDEMDQRRREAAIRVREAKQQRSVTDPEQVLCAAFEGRLDTLFVDETANLYGSFFPDTRTMKEINRPPTGDPADASHDLIEMAIAQTLRHDGHLYCVDTPAMPVAAKMVASIRY